MTISLQIMIASLGAALLFAVIHASIHKKITEPHALLWIFPCILIILGGIFPQLTYFLSHIFNTSYPPAIIFAIAIIMAYLILFQCFKTLSVLTSKNKELASEVAILNQQVEKLNEDIRRLQEEITNEGK